MPIDDLVVRLRNIANAGPEVHLMDWKAICANAAFASNEIARLRVELQKAKDKEAAIFAMLRDPASQ